MNENTISINQIKPSPYQPRIAFDLEDIRGSIQKDGILVPITVRKKNGYYELIDGERRTRLAKDLGYEDIPVTIIDVDDATARRMVWKVNTLRKDYSPKEKAYHFKKLQEQEGMSLRGIARECDYSHQVILAYLNVFKLPEKYQLLTWDGKISITAHIQRLASYFNGTGRIRPPHRVIDWLDRILEQKLTNEEFRKALKPELEEIEKRRVESAKKAVGKITSEVKEPKTPEELEKAAQALKREAKKKREASLTPEEKAKQEAEKQRKKEEHKRKREEKKRREELKRRQQEEQIRKQIEKKAKEEFIEKETPQIRDKIREELIKSPIFQKKILKEIQTSPDSLIDNMVTEIQPAIEKAFKGIKPYNENNPERNRLFLNMFLRNLTNGKLFCPVCNHQMFECSSCHTTLQKMKEDYNL